MSLLPTVNTWIYFVWVTSALVLKIVYPLLKLIQFGFPAIWVFAVEKKKVKFIFPSPFEVLLSVCLGGLIASALWGLYWFGLKGSVLALEVASQIRLKLSMLGVNTPTKFWLMAIGLSFLHSALEEYYWRWFVYGQFRRWLDAIPATLVASVAFVLHHTLVVKTYLPIGSPLVIHFLLAGIVWAGGILWCSQYEKSGSLVGPWISHIGADLTLMGIGYDLVWGF